MNRSVGACRSCNTDLEHTFADLGVTPLCQTHISAEQLNDMEPFYPLHARVCSECLLVQLGQYVTPQDIFEEYAYFSSYSDSWLAHARAYCEMASSRFDLDGDSLVVEIASNDGYLLRNFVAAGIPALGIEPAANVAAVAGQVGVESVTRFFGKDLAQELAATRGKADLLIGNNVLAHVPDLNDFVGGLKLLLAEAGAITMEFPHLQRLMDENQFDTIYHEHFSYFSLLAVRQVFNRHGLDIFDVDQLSTHGGSLRIYAQHMGHSARNVSSSVTALLDQERRAGLHRVETYTGFQSRVDFIKRELLAFLIEQKRAGKSIVGYGAPGKGNTLLNYCGVGPDFLDYTVDRNPYKQGKFTPGKRIPILDPGRIKQTRPDYVLILPWNLKQEIAEKNAYIHDWGGRFVVPIPAVEVLPAA